MGINIFTLIGVVASVIGIILASYALYQQSKEVRRPRNGFTQLRWYLLGLVTIYVVAVSLRIPRLLQVLYQPPVSVSSIIASLSGSVIILSFAVFVFLIYTYKEK